MNLVKLLFQSRLWLVLMGLGASVTLATPGWTQDVQAEARRLLAKYAELEPTIVQVQEEAARYARTHPDAYDSWMSASRWGYLLPRSARIQFRNQEHDRQDVRTTTTGPTNLRQDDLQQQLTVTADWDLTRLVFNRDSVVAARQIERIVNQREDLLTTLNKLYFARRQLQIDLEINPPTSVDRAIRAQLRIDALTADLDALTGGWFSKQLR